MSSERGGRRSSAASVGALSQSEVDGLARLVGDDGRQAMEGERKDVEEGIDFGND